MAERLTDKNTVSVYNNSNSEIYLGKGEEATKYINKLAQLEDILEKYGIEGVDTLEHVIKKGQVINTTIEGFAKEAYNEMEQDRDTWKKACELACEDLQFYDYGNEKTEDGIIMKVDYFYQQAKKEGEQK